MDHLYLNGIIYDEQTKYKYIGLCVNENNDYLHLLIKGTPIFETLINYNQHINLLHIELINYNFNQEPWNNQELVFY